MKVAFRKITKLPLDFKVESNEIIFKGYLEYHSGKLVLLKANLKGFLNKPCDICAEKFKLDIDEDIKIEITQLRDEIKELKSIILESKQVK